MMLSPLLYAYWPFIHPLLWSGYSNRLQLYWVICLFIIELREFFILCILDTNHLSDLCFLNIFSPFMACLFIFFSVFCEQKFLILMKPNLSIFHGYCFLWTKKTVHPRITKISASIFLKSFNFTLGLVHINLVFVYDLRSGSELIFFPYKSSYSRTICWKDFSLLSPPPSLDCFGTFIKNKMSRGFPGGAVVKNPPANAGDKGSSPGSGGYHMSQSN